MNIVMKFILLFQWKGTHIKKKKMKDFKPKKDKSFRKNYRGFFNYYFPKGNKTSNFHLDWIVKRHKSNRIKGDIKIGKIINGGVIMYRFSKQYGYEKHNPLFKYSNVIYLKSIPTKEEFEKLKDIFHLLEHSTLCAGDIELINL